MTPREEYHQRLFTSLSQFNRRIILVKSNLKPKVVAQTFNFLHQEALLEDLFEPVESLSLLTHIEKIINVD